MKSSLYDTIRIRTDITHHDWFDGQARQFKAGTINPITKACAGGYGRFTIPGAHGATATVWSANRHTELVIECSVPRFFTGQNVFGSEDLQGQVLKLVQAVCKHLGIRPTTAEKQAVRDGRVRLNRVDLATHMKLEADADVEHFLKAMKLQLAFGAHYFSAYGNETLYINQHSDMKTLKFYNKGRAIKVHKLHPELPRRVLIEQVSQGLLRVELVMRRRYLERQDIRMVKDWDAANARQLLRSAVADLQLRNVRLTQYEPQATLKNQANALLAAHMQGVDVETIITKNRALKTHAREIAEATGINIFVPFVAQVATAKTDLESFAQSLCFGSSSRAAELGITNALPMIEITETAPVHLQTAVKPGKSSEKVKPGVRGRVNHPSPARAAAQQFRRDEIESHRMYTALSG